jgi:hypothetical protein
MYYCHYEILVLNLDEAIQQSDDRWDNPEKPEAGYRKIE